MASPDTPLVIFGTGNVARMAHFYFSQDSRYRVVAFTALMEHMPGPDAVMPGQLPLVPFEELGGVYSPLQAEMFVAIGYHQANRTRESRIRQCQDAGYTLASYLCSKAIHWGDTKLGQNVLVMEGAILQPDITLEDGVMIGRGSSIGHDTVLETCAFVANQVALCGYNRVGARSFIGSNSTIADGIAIAADNLIGAHSFIKTNTREGDVFAAPQTPAADPRMRLLYNW